MHYVYVLQSKKDKKLYIGCTNNLKKRMLANNRGKVIATKFRTLFTLIFYEAFLEKHDAFIREQWLKSGWGRNSLEKILSTYLKSFGG